MRVRDITWLAGLLDGEGCFGSVRTAKYRYPCITLRMTDLDVVQRAAALLGGYAITSRLLPSGKTAYAFHARGTRAVEWMLTLYDQLGQRRRKKIRELLLPWRKGVQYVAAT